MRLGRKQLNFPWQPQLFHALRLAALALPVAWVVQQAVFGPSGYLALRRTQQQYQQQKRHIHALEVENRQLNRSVRALRTNPQAIESIAREQLHLTRPGEVVYTYPTGPVPPPATDAASLR